MNNKRLFQTLIEDVETFQSSREEAIALFTHDCNQFREICPQSKEFTILKRKFFLIVTMFHIEEGSPLKAALRVALDSTLGEAGW